MNTQTQTKINAILKELGAKPILVGMRGSLAHGMYIPPTDPLGTDDIDLMAIVVGYYNVYLGLESYGSKGTKEIMRDEYDIVAYELKKFLRLLEQGNPNVLSLLWLEDSSIILATTAGKMLIEARDLFAGKHLYSSFTGYAHAQIERMTHGEGSPGRGFMGEKRKEIRAKFGYDTKNAAHAIRLLRMGVEFLETGQLLVNRATKDAVELIEIKQGFWTLKQVTEEADRLFAEAKRALGVSKLPAKPDHEKVSMLCEEILRHQLGI